MAFKKVKVNLHHIKNENTGDDSGDQLEIFGRFDVARLVFDPNIGEVLSFDSQICSTCNDNAIDLEQEQRSLSTGLLNCKSTTENSCRSPVMCWTRTTDSGAATMIWAP